MYCAGEKFVIRDIDDAPTYTCPNNHPERPGTIGEYQLATILGDEPAQPYDGNPNDSRNFHYVHMTYMPEGHAVGEHYHRDNEQFYLVIDGLAEITLCGQKFTAKPYTVAVIRPGGSHGIRNIGKGVMTYVCCEIEPARKYDYELAENSAEEK
ncbi:MAG: cupin domain-containing protein [Oscillospiraceae bacterium]